MIPVYWFSYGIHFGPGKISMFSLECRFIDQFTSLSSTGASVVPMHKTWQQGCTDPELSWTYQHGAILYLESFRAGSRHQVACMLRASLCSQELCWISSSVKMWLNRTYKRCKNYNGNKEASNEKTVMEPKMRRRQYRCDRTVRMRSRRRKTITIPVSICNTGFLHELAKHWVLHMNGRYLFKYCKTQFKRTWFAQCAEKLYLVNERVNAWFHGVTKNQAIILSSCKRTVWFSHDRPSAWHATCYT